HRAPQQPSPERGRARLRHGGHPRSRPRARGGSDGPDRARGPHPGGRIHGAGGAGGRRAPRSGSSLLRLRCLRRRDEVTAVALYTLVEMRRRRLLLALVLIAVALMVLLGIAP